MGTINYGHSDIITIGLKPYDYDDVHEWLIDGDEFTEDTIDDSMVINEKAQLKYEDFVKIKEIVENYDLSFFWVTIEAGYYEGFFVKITENIGECVWDYTERTDVQKELTKLKEMLKKCVDNGLVECHPGWCTGYEDSATTIRSINSAICGMRQYVRSLPTFRQYEKQRNKG